MIKKAHHNKGVCVFNAEREEWIGEALNPLYQLIGRRINNN